MPKCACLNLKRHWFLQIINPIFLTNLCSPMLTHILISVLMILVVACIVANRMIEINNARRAREAVLNRFKERSVRLLRSAKMVRFKIENRSLGPAELDNLKDLYEFTLAMAKEQKIELEKFAELWTNIQEEMGAIRKMTAPKPPKKGMVSRMLSFLF